MRQNVIIALLSVCATLLGLDLYLSLRKTELPVALGQSVGTPSGSVALATGGGQSNEPWVYLYDVGSQRLVSYTNRGQGIELKGVRQITWDLEIPELPANLANKRLSVKDIKAEVAKQKPAGGSAGGGKSKAPEEPEEEEEAEEPPGKKK